METLCRTSLAAVENACGSGFLSAAQLKEMLKFVQSAVRQTKRVFTVKEVTEIWQPSKWDEVCKKLASSDTFKSAVGLQSICKQIVQIAGRELKGESGAGKRKADKVVEKQDDDEDAKKPKRKKVKKVQRS